MISHYKWDTLREWFSKPYLRFDLVYRRGKETFTIPANIRRTTPDWIAVDISDDLDMDILPSDDVTVVDDLIIFHGENFIEGISEKYQYTVTLVDGTVITGVAIASREINPVWVVPSDIKSEQSLELTN
jgi:hypothetical protein